MIGEFLREVFADSDSSRTSEVDGFEPKDIPRADYTLAGTLSDELQRLYMIWQKSLNAYRDENKVLQKAALSAEILDYKMKQADVARLKIKADGLFQIFWSSVKYELPQTVHLTTPTTIKIGKDWNVYWKFKEPAHFQRAGYEQE